MSLLEHHGEHPFDRYAKYTNVELLKEYSALPLRKCMRVNTLKMSVEEFQKYASEQGWKIDPVPWCLEGFFIDREDRSQALGKDLRHLLGHVYMQEASSMLPVELLDPQPHEAVLDMAAAPGSKSTQIAAKMQNTGVLMANDMQEMRLRTLQSAIHRLGVVNVIVTKKVGQWFSGNMTGRFDRVLIDAPCTGQGTARKDPNALQFCSELSIGKNAKLQRELLESAIHATKIGGRIVYSTCTLTPEENEDVVLSVLERLAGKVEVIDPRTEHLYSSWDCTQAIEDSFIVQKSFYGGKKKLEPFLRIWPQTYNSEGFFCAVLRKVAPTRDPKPNEEVPLQYERLPKTRMHTLAEYVQKKFGMTCIYDNEVLIQNKERLWVTTKSALKFRLPLRPISIGLPFGKAMTKSPIRLDHDFVTLRGGEATSSVCDVQDHQIDDLLHAKDTDCDPLLQGHILLHYNGYALGRAKALEGVCKNQLPRWMVQVFSS